MASKTKKVKKATPKKAVKKTVKKVAKKVTKKAPKKAAKTTAPKKAGKKRSARRPNRVPPRIIRKVSPAQKQATEEYTPIDTAKAVAFGMSIVEQLKREAAAQRRKEEKVQAKDEISLARRPTTRKQGKETVKFPDSDLKEFKRRLMQARVRATQGVDAMKATGFNESEDHEADGGDGTAQTLRLQALGQMGNINRVIQQIDEALHRIEDGSYGVCTVCGQLIRKPRLMNQPFVLTCMECQSEMEKAGQ